MQTKSAKCVFIKKPELPVLDTKKTETPDSLLSNILGETADNPKNLNQKGSELASGQDKNLIEILSQSIIFQEFYSAYTEAFDLPVFDFFAFLVFFFATGLVSFLCLYEVSFTLYDFANLISLSEGSCS